MFTGASKIERSRRFENPLPGLKVRGTVIFTQNQGFSPVVRRAKWTSIPELRICHRGSVL
jgi:hypothetical protein